MRPAAALAALGLALAVGAPTAWSLTREGTTATAGTPVEEALQASPTQASATQPSATQASPTPASPPEAPPSRLPAVATRSAGPAVQQEQPAPARLTVPRLGDEVLVTDTAETTRWRVVARELIEKRVLPLDRLFAREGPPRLTLITRGGPFLPESGSYRDNVVVVAEPVT